MEDGYVICPRCHGKEYIQLGWKFLEGTSDDIRVPTDEKEPCEACKDSKYPGYVYMPPTVAPDGSTHPTEYAKEHRKRYY